MSEARHQTSPDWIARHDNYWNFSGRLFRCKRAGRVKRDDDVNLQGHQFCSKLGKLVELLLRRSKFEEKVLSFYITGLTQFFAQLGLKRQGIRISVPYDKHTNPTQVGFLCTRAKRPHQSGRNAAQDCNKLATLHIAPRHGIGPV